MTAEDQVQQALAATIAAERLPILASLIRVVGDWELAEDCVQDAAEKALVRWAVDGIPRTPAAWLTTVARNRALDVLRRHRTERAKLAQVAIMAELGRGTEPPDGSTITDDQLRLIFTCCHPALSLDSRVALTLKSVAGLSTPAIARAFLLSDATLSQRLLRAKRKIGHAAIGFRVPSEGQLPERTSGVLAVIYLIFNAGYDSPDPSLAVEALRLARLLVDLMPDEDEARGLLALIILQLARRPTRFDADGDLVAMADQDRGQWVQAMIEEGQWQLRRASHSPRAAGPYRLQAAIACCHATATTAESTDWVAIVSLYDDLLTIQPSPVAALNRAVAIGFRDGPEAGLTEVAGLDPGALAGYYLLDAVQADLLARLGRRGQAYAAYREAARSAPTEAGRRFLERRADSQRVD